MIPEKLAPRQQPDQNTGGRKFHPLAGRAGRWRYGCRHCPWRRNPFSGRGRQFPR